MMFNFKLLLYGDFQRKHFSTLNRICVNSRVLFTFLLLTSCCLVTGTLHNYLYYHQLQLTPQAIFIQVPNATHNRNSKSYPPGDSVSLKGSILKDMKRCSQAMGISPDKLTADKDKIERIATKASLFLNALWEVVPERNKLDLKNPCWISKMNIPQDIENVIKANTVPSEFLNNLKETQINSFAYSLFHNESSNSTQSIYCLPYLLLAGFPKGGTTTLDSVLRQHPQIAAPEHKEPKWWSRVSLENMNKEYIKVAFVRYLSNFRSASSHIGRHLRDGIITYDASTTFTVDSNFREKQTEVDYCAQLSVISRVLPNAKIIIAMREPISRLYSAYFNFHGNYTTWPMKMQINASLFFHVGVSRVVQRF